MPRLRDESPGEGDADTRELLSRWYGGDRSALEALLEVHLPWIRSYVRARLGPALRERFETMDVVQDAAVDVLEYGPKFVTSNARQFRALLAKILQNNLRDRARWLQRHQKLDVGGEHALDLDRTVEAAASVDEDVIARDIASWTRLAMELLSDEDRRVIELRQLDELSFEDVGETLGLSTDAARMRFHRALPRLANHIAVLRGGRIETLLE